MDSKRFDDLSKRFASARLNRATVLRGLAAGAAVFTGVTLASEDTEAKRRRKEKKVCNCLGTTLESCQQIRVNRKKRKKFLKKTPCAYKGNCKNFNPCGPGGSCAVNTDCPGGQQCINATCSLECTGNGQCSGGQVCLNGTCATACTAPGQCPGGQTCVNGACVGLCTSDANCTGPQRCLNGVCAVPPAVTAVCDQPSDCTGGLLCVAGACVAGCATNADCTGGLVCGDLLGNKVCVGAQCSPTNPCAGGALVDVCLLGICVKL